MQHGDDRKIVEEGKCSKAEILKATRLKGAEYPIDFESDKFIRIFVGTIYVTSVFSGLSTTNANDMCPKWSSVGSRAKLSNALNSVG